MLLGFSTLGCPDLDLPSATRLAAAHGLDFIELRALGGEVLTRHNLSRLWPETASPPSPPVRVVGASLRLFVWPSPSAA